VKVPFCSENSDEKRALAAAERAAEAERKASESRSEPKMCRISYQGEGVVGW
jgi:hypothetical protein